MSDIVRGAYDQLVTAELEARLRAVAPELISNSPLDPADAHDVLARYVGQVARRALRSAAGDDSSALIGQIRMANKIIEALAAVAPDGVDAGHLLVTPGSVLKAIAARPDHPGLIAFPRRPETPLSESALLVNGRGQPSVGTEIKSELASADRVDLLCAFVKWHGVRVIEDEIRELKHRGVPLRVITTTYMGASEQRAIDRLAELGAEVRISYETRTTRLHAKAWLFERNSTFSTAYVGSSNLSRAAMLDGLEWNVRLNAVEQPHLLETFRATFDQYWADPSFEAYDPTNEADVERLRAALENAGAGRALPLQLAAIDIRPYGYQQEILDALTAERDLHGRMRNLVVMATGTGKTVVAALDYRRLRNQGKIESVLFVAHRQEILDQSLAMFRHVLRSGTFGERFVGGDRPRQWQHVFASIQSLAQLDLAVGLRPDLFDMVIVDEFHHASEETKTYATLLQHLRPKILLGLTATPERADGQDVRVWFGGHTAVELRLWEALEQGLLSPFQYFGIHDGTDLRSIRWKRGAGYDVVELTNLYTAHDARVAIVVQAVLDKITDVTAMRALGFCVSIDHAEYMASRFNQIGIPSLALSSRSSTAQRSEALDALRQRRVNVVFTVDLFNEGIDLPAIDTVLFLRPTESATVFLQQLGRGLRQAEDKPCLTVLDFIGHQHADFRYDLRYRALTGTSRPALARAIAEGFPTLPAGCRIELDRVASDLVLDNVRSSLRINWQSLAAELKRLGDCSLQEFLANAEVSLDDLYRRSRGGWTDLRRRAGFDQSQPGPDDERLGRAIGRMLHIDDRERLEFISTLVSQAQPPISGKLPERQQRLLGMLHFALWGSDGSVAQLEQGLSTLWQNPRRREELSEVLAVLREGIGRVTTPLDQASRVPLHIHARYSRDEALAAFGVDTPGTVRQGVRWVESEQADLFFVTLRKSEHHYSPSTMYEDRAITPWLFQWESQSTTSEVSATGQRYIHQRERGTSVHFFIRESKEADGDRGAPPYLYAGTAQYVSHRGDRPLRIIWKLGNELPADMFHAARVAAG